MSSRHSLRSTSSRAMSSSSPRGSAVGNQSQNFPQQPSCCMKSPILTSFQRTQSMSPGLRKRIISQRSTRFCVWRLWRACVILYRPFPPDAARMFQWMMISQISILRCVLVLLWDNDGVLILPITGAGQRVCPDQHWTCRPSHFFAAVKIPYFVATIQETSAWEYCRPLPKERWLQENLQGCHNRAASLRGRS